MKVKAAVLDKYIKELVARGVSSLKELLHKIQEKLFPALNEGIRIILIDEFRKASFKLNFKVLVPVI